MVAWGDASLLWGGMRGCSGEACMVARGVHGCSGEGGGCGCSGGVCVVAPGGGMHGIQRDTDGHTVNERAVRILLECILVFIACKSIFCKKYDK